MQNWGEIRGKEVQKKDNGLYLFLHVFCWGYAFHFFELTIEVAKVIVASHYCYLKYGMIFISQ